MRHRPTSVTVIDDRCERRLEPNLVKMARPALGMDRAIDGEIVTIIPAGRAELPQREGGQAVNRIEQLTGLLIALAAEGTAIDELAFRKSLEARAAASIKALANDLACYGAFVERERGIGLPASPARLVAYLDDCERRKLKPATVGRRLASLAVIHGLLGVPSPTLAPVVRDALRGMRRRVGVRQRQAGDLRYGEGIGIEAARGFTLTALLMACDGSLIGLRDAALLSLAYDSGLRVSELVAVACDDIAIADDGAAVLTIGRSKTDQEGQGAYAWLSPDTVRRVALWRDQAGIMTGVVFRRIGVRRTKARAALPAPALPAPPGYRWRVPGAARRGTEAIPATTTFLVGETALTPAAVRLIIKRTARRAADQGLVGLFGVDVDAAITRLSTHSLRVGLTQDLFASGEDAGPVAQALRWSSTATALRYGQALAPTSNATARMLGRLRT